MDAKVIALTQFQSEATANKSDNVVAQLGSVFGEYKTAYLNGLQLFRCSFGEIPNFIADERINCLSAKEWLMNNHAADIRNVHFNMRCLRKSYKTELDDVFFFLKDDLIIYFDINRSEVSYYFRNTPIMYVWELMENIKKFKKRRVAHIPTISLLVHSPNGIDTKTRSIKKPKLNIEDNYNDDFLMIHQTILKRLSKKNDKGLVLLHGKPGTGKTSYIRYLVASLRKEIIFLPPNMASAITNPSLISILLDNPNSIFVIEDAENIVIDRERNGESPVSALLNISDGLLSDCLNIQIICSFNTDISKVDSALMRKGRLIAKYEFKELEVHKARALSHKLGFQSSITAPMTLTAIYNQDETEFQQTRKMTTIGFRAVHEN